MLRRRLKRMLLKDLVKKQNFINTWMLFVRLGDKGAIVVGSWTVRRDRLKKGINIDEIINEYETFSSETQQSADLSRLSNFQRGGSLEHLFSMFKSSQRQYLAKEINAIKSLFQKDGLTSKNVAKVTKTLAIYHVLLPVTFQYISNFGGWDEDDKKEYLRAGLIGSLNGLFIFGDIIDKITRMALGLRTWDNALPMDEFFESLFKTLKEFDFDDISNSDFAKIIKELSDAGNGLGFPTAQLRNILGGIGDIIDGDTKEGVGRLLGWSEFQVQQEKKKKGGN